MIHRLIDISDIRFGYYTQEFVLKGIPYLQARQFDEYGNMISLCDTFVDKNSKNTSYLLKDGDVLLAGKGNKIFAWTYHKSFGPAIASTIFFVIRPNQKVVLPAYLTTILNHPKSQMYFQKAGGGSNIFSIRKNELGEFKVPIGPLEGQAKIVALSELHRTDVHLTQQMLQKKNELFDAIIYNLTKS